MSQKISFVNKDKTKFYAVLKQRVDDYFTSNNLSPHANEKMIFKTVMMLSLYFIPYILILTTGMPLWLMWVMTVVMGVGLAGIGMSVMHDANHGAYSSNSFINTIVGQSLNLVGGDAENWKIQHNILHHTYTNIHGHDDDINGRMNMRFSPVAKHNRLQVFQPFYVLFFYAQMTLWWATGKDFAQFVRYNEPRHQRMGKSARLKSIAYIILWKIIYFGYMVALPLLVLNITWWQLLIGFLTLHFVAGLILSIVFQLAHVVEGTSFPQADESGNIENEWAIHQLKTTADFAENNKLLTFYVGGLNYQVVHHLFPRVCHVHYPQIAPIVKQTADEFGIPYLYNPSFFSALRSHFRMLTKLGNNSLRLELN